MNDPAERMIAAFQLSLLGKTAELDQTPWIPTPEELAEWEDEATPCVCAGGGYSAPCSCHPE